MKAKQFKSYVAGLVAKTAGQPLEDIDPEFDLSVYFDPGMEACDQVTCAHLAAAEVLFENGFIEQE
jgi:hypothetical protein